MFSVFFSDMLSFSKYFVFLKIIYSSFKIMNFFNFMWKTVLDSVKMFNNLIHKVHHKLYLAVKKSKVNRNVIIFFFISVKSSINSTIQSKINFSRLILL